jgi:peptidoglycan/xylan/chitin deacetylase (PgdA/CDA1 family)
MFAADILSRFFPDVIFRVNTTGKKLFLTFDDGPTPEVTPWVLEELKKYKAHATFFCIGRNVERNPELFSEIISHGHSIGNHTMNHLNGWKTSRSFYRKDVAMCEDVLRASGIRNQESGFFRPPYGKLTLTQYIFLKKNYRIAMWDVLSRDFDAAFSGEECLQRVVTKAKPGSVVVFHDSMKAEKNLRYVLPQFLNYLSERGYKLQNLNADNYDD